MFRIQCGYKIAGNCVNVFDICLCVGSMCGSNVINNNVLW